MSVTFSFWQVTYRNFSTRRGFAMMTNHYTMCVTTEEWQSLSMDRWDHVKIKVRLRSQVLCSGTLSDRSDHGEWRRADPSDHHLLETPGRLGGWRPPDRTGLILHTAPLNLPVVHANSVMPQAKQSLWLWMSSSIAENSSIWPVSGCCFLHHIILGWVCSLKTASSVLIYKVL